ncbi:NAD(P)H-dependent glycerol-3-phosphate dehydrogenase [soil metagenome]
MQTKNIAVIGGGSWATAIVKILSNNVENIHWWLRKEETVAFIQQYRHNPNYLSDVEMDLTKVKPSSDLKMVIQNADFIILAVPAAFLQEALKLLVPEDFKGKKVFSAIKGIVPQHNQIAGDFIHTQFNVDFNCVGVITGPCHAEEVALEKLSYLTIACSDNATATLMAESLNCRYIKTITSDDIFGTEYAAVLKNVMALASGICHGLGYGDNFQAVLISSAIREIKRFVDVVHPIKRDINDSAYLGDLLVTAYSQFSRNRTFGSMIGKGYSVKSAQLEMNMIAEGYFAVACIHEINKQYQVDMPICLAVYNIVYEKIAARVEMKLLSDKLH